MKTIQQAVEKKFGHYPEKILQFGEGNFLRAFADWMIELANRDGLYQGSILLCQPIAQGMGEKINAQDGLYTLAMRGMENNTAVEKIETITSVSRCINPYEDYEALLAAARSADLEVVISNTTEAGIAYKAGDKLSDRPASSFPAKVTALLYERYKAFGGAQDKGLLFLSVELIDRNGDKLKEIVLQYAKEWELEPEFIRWIEIANKFTNTLVDRIVSGYPKDETAYFEEKLGYKDELIVTSEVFNLWVIEGDEKWAEILPIHKTAANVLWTRDITPYKTRKVRILNGGHTSTVLAAYLSGHGIVLDFMNDPLFKDYLHKLIFGEVIPTLDLPKEELESFAASVGDRFANPYIKHNLLDISLNSCSKFNARCLPSLLEYQKRTGKLPELLVFSLAAFIRFYQCKEENGAYTGVREDGTSYPVRDDKEVLEFFEKVWSTKDYSAIAKAVLSQTSFWSGKDLTEVPGLLEATAENLKNICEKGVKITVENLLR